jgi:large repetitive protein
VVTLTPFRLLALSSFVIFAALPAQAQVFSIAPTGVTEGTGGASNLVYTVTATPAPAASQTVQFISSNGTAAAGTDYTATSGTLTFGIGVTTRTISVPIATDSTVEANETLSMTLSNPVGGATLGTAVALGTITNDDSAVISVNAPAVTEGNVGNTPLPFIVSISNPVQGAVSFTYTAADGNNVNPLLNATLADLDYVASTSSVSFASDSVLPLTVNVPIVGDTEVEPNQVLRLNLSNLVLPGGVSAANVTFAASGVGTINNDDGAVLSIAGVSIAEGATGSSNANFVVTLSNTSKTPVTVQYASADGTATAGSDYTASSGTLTFAPGVLTQTIAVPVAGDNIVEANETFTITLSAPNGATLGTAIGTGTITNDDTAVLSLNSPAQIEGNAGNTPMNFTATLSNPVQGGVTATLNTADGNNVNPLLNATVADNDYVALSAGALSISGTTQVIPVQIVGDTDVEPNQSFRLTISGLTLPAGVPAAAVTLGAQGVGTINNDDATGLSISNVTLTEGNAGTSTMTFNVTLSAPNKDPVSVNFATGDVSATAGLDYVARSGTLNFASNVVTQPIAITINGDAIFENDETFNITLSAPVGATIATGSAIGTITDDDTLALSIADATGPEGNAAAPNTLSFVVSLAGASSLPVTVQYASSNGTAVAPGDYAAVSGTLNFAPGENSKTISVTLVSDLIVENPETFAITLTNPTPVNPRVTIGRAIGTGTISNDDAFTPVPLMDWRGMVMMMLALLLIGALATRKFAS